MTLVTTFLAESSRMYIKKRTDSVPSQAGGGCIYHKTTTLSEHTAERINRKVSGSEWWVKLPHLCFSTNIWQTDGPLIFAVQSFVDCSDWLDNLLLPREGVMIANLETSKTGRKTKHIRDFVSCSLVTFLYGFLSCSFLWAWGYFTAQIRYFILFFFFSSSSLLVLCIYCRIFTRFKICIPPSVSECVDAALVKSTKAMSASYYRLYSISLWAYNRLYTFPNIGPIIYLRDIHQAFLC